MKKADDDDRNGAQDEKEGHQLIVKLILFSLHKFPPTNLRLRCTYIINPTFV